MCTLPNNLDTDIETQFTVANDTGPMTELKTYTCVRLDILYFYSKFVCMLVCAGEWCSLLKLLLPPPLRLHRI